MQWGQALGVGMAVCIQYSRPIPPIMTPNAFTLSNTFVYTEYPYVTSSHYTFTHTLFCLNPSLTTTHSNFTTFPMPSIYTQCRHLLLYLKMPTPFSLPNTWPSSIPNILNLSSNICLHLFSHSMLCLSCTQWLHLFMHENVHIRIWLVGSILTLTKFWISTHPCILK